MLMTGFQKLQKPQMELQFWNKHGGPNQTLMAYKTQWQNGRWLQCQIPETPKRPMHALTREKDAPESLFHGV